MSRYILREGVLYQVMPDGSEQRVTVTPPRYMTDAEIEAAALSDPDNLPLTEADFARMKRREPR